ncbi:PREDICTED: Werner Syndrome-like exonuclease [Nelumbo nucifera]|uniref:3'-5' exonuclease domain-containing protein n=2 Tax=Nelumbo nucifera TaxID=4432 RepID=A0A822ZP59_NELNU|nr:PREDICTED: Werner Syndrome-like exonuclease [Nelumbo nucifera]DAD45285.1 TPA_asm: hypothetical protein HUJ06_003515 [Nelumbo nucifera]
MYSSVVNIQGVGVETTVLNTASSLGSFIELTMNSSFADMYTNTRPVVGLDIEWNSSSPNSKVSILQLCSDTRCLIIQLRHLGCIPLPLMRLLACSPGVNFVGVGITEDVSKLWRDYGIIFEYTAVHELGPLAARVLNKPHLTRAGLAELAREVVGLNVEKPTSVTRSNWDATYLSAEQIKYATIDAYASFLIGKRLSG